CYSSICHLREKPGTTSATARTRMGASRLSPRSRFPDGNLKTNRGTRARNRDEQDLRGARGGLAPVWELFLGFDRPGRMAPRHALHVFEEIVQRLVGGV